MCDANLLMPFLLNFVFASKLSKIEDRQCVCVIITPVHIVDQANDQKISGFIAKKKLFYSDVIWSIYFNDDIYALK